MKKFTRSLLITLFTLMILCASISPAFADYSLDMDFDEFHKEALKEFEEAKKDNAALYSSIANKYKEEFEEAKKENEEKFNNAKNSFDFMFIFVIIIIVLALLLTLGAIIYIFIEAPKCNMSRLWALVPLFSSLLGLLVFIVVRSASKSKSKTNTFICPVCNGVHPKN